MSDCAGCGQPVDRGAVLCIPCSEHANEIGLEEAMRDSGGYEAARELAESYFRGEQAHSRGYGLNRH